MKEHLESSGGVKSGKILLVQEVVNNQWREPVEAELDEKSVELNNKMRDLIGLNNDPAYNDITLNISLTIWFIEPFYALDSWVNRFILLPSIQLIQY